MRKICSHLIENPGEVAGLVIATVVSTSGSTPQKPGSSALINGSGLVFGTVGGGILEAKIIETGISASLTGKSGCYSFRLDNEAPEGEDALCGGRIEILVDADPGKNIRAFSEMHRCVKARMAGILVTLVTGNSETGVRIERHWIERNPGEKAFWGLESLPGVNADELIKAAESGEYGEFSTFTGSDIEKSRIFIEPVVPPLRLIIAGAGHIAKALSKISKMLDFEVTIIDDRPEFANRENIPEADNILVSDIGKMMSKLDKGPDTFIVIVTRGHRDDSAALSSCIGSEAAYVGMIGSRAKVERMRNEFISAKRATPDQWAKIFTPVGLDIGSRTVEEIALSIAAQMVLVKNRKN